MDEERFDFLTRLLSSRRSIFGSGFGAVLAWLIGGRGAEAKSKPCGKTQKRCGKRCIPKRTCCLITHKRCGTRCVPKRACCPGTKRCGVACIPVTHCCADAECGGGRLCANGTCVIGQGTCPTGADVCEGALAECGTTSTCLCFETNAGATRCGDENALSGCNTCATDAGCAALFPNVPGVFCADGGNRCGTSCERFCLRPCSS